MTVYFAQYFTIYALWSTSLHSILITCWFFVSILFIWLCVVTRATFSLPYIFHFLGILNLSLTQWSSFLRCKIISPPSATVRDAHSWPICALHDKGWWGGGGGIKLLVIFAQLANILLTERKYSLDIHCNFQSLSWMRQKHSISHELCSWFVTCVVSITHQSALSISFRVIGFIYILQGHPIK